MFVLRKWTQATTTTTTTTIPPLVAAGDHYLMWILHHQPRKEHASDLATMPLCVWIVQFGYGATPKPVRCARPSSQPSQKQFIYERVLGFRVVSEKED